MTRLTTSPVLFNLLLVSCAACSAAPDQPGTNGSEATDHGTASLTGDDAGPIFSEDAGVPSSEDASAPSGDDACAPSTYDSGLGGFPFDDDGGACLCPSTGEPVFGVLGGPTGYDAGYECICPPPAGCGDDSGVGDRTTCAVDGGAPAGEDGGI